MGLKHWVSPIMRFWEDLTIGRTVDRNLRAFCRSERTGRAKDGCWCAWTFFTLFLLLLFGWGCSIYREDIRHKIRRATDQINIIWRRKWKYNSLKFFAARCAKNDAKKLTRKAKKVKLLDVILATPTIDIAQRNRQHLRYVAYIGSNILKVRLKLAVLWCKLVIYLSPATFENWKLPNMYDANENWGTPLKFGGNILIASNILIEI